MKDKQRERADVSRRHFLGLGIGVIAASVIASLGWSGTRYALTPALAKKSSSTAVNLGSVDSFTVNEPQDASYDATVVDGWYVQSEKKAAWVVKKSADKFDVFDPHCTHLGCAYHWDKDSKSFKCPCHGGVFDINGNVLAGPPPRPLIKLNYRIQDGQLFITE